ncbi:CopG family transcriptional regulator [Hydrococcus rivularis NIES-593]|uniref:CopG family transcriptional regulator n=1 Tax=Hydrococcus rivularis NIES-593 TaxID=1921803 RepID=A0A1U7HG38_9CYAN|nr:CopG family transcriptional regulator [Hydrococcus rivularis]OKH22562.1 CopG family transcriptional regulator [Hydrococcus rivularis NIES-593]
MSKETITFRVDSDKRKALDEIASILDRDRTYILNEAIDYYLEIYRWQIEEIQKGITEADAGDFASDEEVDAALAKLIHES